MPGVQLERAVATMVARARLYERIAHDRGPWGAVAHGALAWPMTLERHEHGNSVVLTGYLAYPAVNITAIDIWCRGDFLVSWPVSPPYSGPVRVCFEVGVEDAELAA